MLHSDDEKWPFLFIERNETELLNSFQWNWFNSFWNVFFNPYKFTSDDLFSMVKEFYRNIKWRTFYFGVQAMAILLQSRTKFSCCTLVSRNGSHIERILRDPRVRADDNWLINKYENLSTWRKMYTYRVTLHVCIWMHEWQVNLLFVDLKINTWVDGHIRFGAI